MKAGDLVRLSEYGIKRDYNHVLTTEDPYQVGVVINVVLGSYPYKVHWVKGHQHQHTSLLVNTHSRKELKYAR